MGTLFLVLLLGKRKCPPIDSLSRNVREAPKTPSVGRHWLLECTGPSIHQPWVTLLHSPTSLLAIGIGTLFSQHLLFFLSTPPYFYCICMGICLHGCSSPRGQKCAWDLQGPGLQLVLHILWLLGMKPGSSGREASAFHCRTISAALSYPCLMV